MAMTRPLAITMGDPAGIGPEIIAKAFRDSPAELAGCVMVGDVATLRRAAQLVGIGRAGGLAGRSGRLEGSAAALPSSATKM